MSFIRRKIKRFRVRWNRATRLPKLKQGTRFPVQYRLRKFLLPDVYIPSYVESYSGARHFLSSDPTDDRVVEEMFDQGFHLFFPELPESIKDELNNGGWILDVGAYNGSWGVEFLMRYPSLQAIFLEPNPDKCHNITKTIEGSGVGSKGRIVPAALAESTGQAWLVKSEDGSWGDWLEYKVPIEKDNAIKVSTTTLLKALDGAKPTIVKCNAEGGEFEFVKQLLVTDIRPEIMILMIHPEQGDANKLGKDLRQAGYTIEVIKDHPRRPVWHVKWK